MSIPEVEPHHIIEAIEFIGENGVPFHNQSLNYELVANDGRKYPPKYVLAVALHLATGEKIDTTGFHSNDAVGKLRELGFSVRQVSSSQHNAKEDGAYRSKSHYSNSQIPSSRAKNIILYGPPGTGKTYSVAELAWSIAHDNAECTDHRAAKEWYDEQLSSEDGQVAFTTFHQSFSYEDFIEGIRPAVSENEGESETNGSLTYRVADGVFKSFCERAETPIALEDFGLNSNPTVWKVSLNGTYDNPIRSECLANGHIRIGWDSYGPNVEDRDEFTHGGKTVLNAFYNKMRKGDIVVSCYSATIIDAIGVVTGDPEWHDEHDDFKRQRNVSWLVKDIRFDIVDRFNIPNMTLSTIYQLRLDEADILGLVAELTGHPGMTEANTKPYIFIIDEINRGNISRIFGELITLLEESKRKGAPDQQTVILPYSKTKFSIPENIYIVGTMNTADRSLTQIDTALRRRFEFVEMAPKPETIEPASVDSPDGPIDLRQVLEAINSRIEILYDREHLIGHSYLMGIKSFEELKSAFSTKIIPLLQEYFYDDGEKVRLVLGDKGNFTGFFVKRYALPSEQESERTRARIDRYLQGLNLDGECLAPALANPSRWTPVDFIHIYDPNYVPTEA